MFFLAIQPTKTSLGDLAVMISRLRAHNTVAIPTSIFLDYREIFIHILGDEVIQQHLLIHCRLDLLFDPFGAVCDGVEGCQFLLGVVADLLIDVEAEGEEVEEHLMGDLLRELDGDF